MGVLAGEIFKEKECGMKREGFRPDSMFSRKMSRKEFMKLMLLGAATLPFFKFFSNSAEASTPNFNGRPKRAVEGLYDLVVAKGEDPYSITLKAVESIGGMEKFVKNNDVVVVKPNIGWDRSPEQAGNTNPQVVAALIDMAFKAGAKKVKVFDATCNDARRCYTNSGIGAIAKEHGADVFFVEDWNVVKANFPYESPMEGWPILRDAIECDTFINVPILKNHGLTTLTLSMKNLMGVCAGRRGPMHDNIGRKLVDLTDFINPELTVIDAYRVLLRNGPTGGDLEDVATMKTVIVSTDPTLADTYACGLVDVAPESVQYIEVAMNRGFGKYDINSAHKNFINV